MAQQSNKIVKATPTILDVEQVRGKIYIIHGVPVMFDFDLAKCYGIETKVLKQAVNRNIDSFPEDFIFKLSTTEANELIFNGRSQIVTPPGYKSAAFTKPSMRYRQPAKSHVQKSDTKQVVIKTKSKSKYQSILTQSIFNSYK